MKDDSIHQPPPPEPGSGQEEWIPKEKILEIFPTLLDRTLTEWRTDKKVRYKIDRYKNIKNYSWYIESEIRAMVEEHSRPKKYIRIREKYIPKKLATLDNGVILLIVAFGFAFIYLDPFGDNKSFSRFQVLFPFYVMGSLAVLYWVVRFIQYIWKRFIRSDENKQ